jgi:Tyrosine phosphatase family
MLVMLLQSLLGVSDDEIIEDYFLSNASFQKKKEESSAAAAADAASSRSKGKLDRNKFSGTNRKAMVATLAFLRSKYGSVGPGYLDQIGFNEQWRRRLIAVLTAAHPARSSDDMSGATKNVLEATSFSSSTLPISRL